MKYEKEYEEIIQFCLQHDLIKKTEHGYIIQRHLFDILDLYDEKRGENYHDINWGTEEIHTKLSTSTS